MNAKSFYAIAAIATVAAAFTTATAQAGEISTTDNVQQFQGQRTRAEVRAEAVAAAHNYNFEREASRVSAPVQSAVSRQAVRAEVAQALRQGRIASGEASI